MKPYTGATMGSVLDQDTGLVIHSSEAEGPPSPQIVARAIFKRCGLDIVEDALTQPEIVTKIAEKISDACREEFDDHVSLHQAKEAAAVEWVDDCSAEAADDIGHMVKEALEDIQQKLEEIASTAQTAAYEQAREALGHNDLIVE
jgi:hypothetical protein